jgi:hypothetical protein
MFGRCRTLVWTMRVRMGCIVGGYLVERATPADAPRKVIQVALENLQRLSRLWMESVALAVCC